MPCGRSSGGVLLLLAASLLFLTGCGPSRPALAPVTGKVLYKGQPLAFGSVMFQPEGGQPARAVIQPDGTFVLWTYKEGDGAAIGKHKIRVTCYEGQKAPAPGEEKKERGLGANLIPVRYNSIDTSGLTAEVKKQNEPVVLELVD